MFSFFIVNRVKLSSILILLSNILIFGIYLVIKGIRMILCFISVIRKVCLNDFFKSSFCSIVLVGTRKSCLFP